MAPRRRISRAWGLVVASATLGAPASAQLFGSPMPGPGHRGTAGFFTYRLRARFHFDLVDARLVRIGELLGESFDDSVDVRRARLLADLGFRKGTWLEPLTFRGHVDFEDGIVGWKDLTAEISLGAPGPLRWSDSRLIAGQAREPFGLEAKSSSTYLPFIERSIATNVFTPGRSRGVQWAGLWDHALVQAGYFRRSIGEPFPNVLNEESATTLRAVYQSPDGPLIQAGGSVSFRQPGGDPLRFQSRPGTRLLPRTEDTGDVFASGAITAGLEAAIQRGRWTSYAEWFGAWIDDPNGSPTDAFLSGGHVAITAMLTGEAGSWNRWRGGWRAPNVPDVWHSRENGNGAIEAALRVTWVDLEDGAISGGRSLDIETGLNWYLQPATRFMLHWLGIFSEVPSRGDAFGSAILARIQVQL